MVDCDLQEQASTPDSMSTASAGGVTSQVTTSLTTGEQTEDEGDDDVTLELPPPMEEIQTHPLPTATSMGSASAQPVTSIAPEEDAHSKLVRK